MSTQMSAPAAAALRYVPIGRTPEAHEVDWSTAPPRYKRYPHAERVVLDWDPAAPRPQSHGGELSRLLRDLYGQTGIRWAYPANSPYQHPPAPPHVTATRRVPSGGALYPLSIYLAAGSHHDIPPGLYHYDAAHHVLDLLRPGDHRAALTTSLASPADEEPGLVLVVTTRFWRNAFKYQEFGYRLQSQETGILAAQALALAGAMNLSAAVHLHFADARLNRLIGLEPLRESVIAVLTFTGTGATIPAVSRPPSYGELVAEPVTVAAPEPRDITGVLPVTSALHTSALLRNQLPEPYSVDIPLPFGRKRVALPDARSRLEDGIAGRTSPPHGFTGASLSPQHVAAILAAASAGHDRAVRTVPYCLLLRVTGIAPGAYRYLPEDNALLSVGGAHVLHRILVEPGQNILTRLALNEAGMALIPVGSYEAGVRAHGDRWYRLQNIDAGMMMHRATLAATAGGLGARIFSDGTRDTVDDTLGLAGSPHESLSMLLVGHRRPSPTQLDFAPGARSCEK